jgi:hypothetical protein
MKTRATLFLLLVAAAAGVFWFSASVSATDKTPAVPSHNVVINRGGIVIPGTQITKADQEAMNRILNKYDKSLYRIDTYENGKLKKTEGKLTDVVTDKQLASEIAVNVKRAGFTESAVQIRAGSPNHPQTTAVVNHPQTTAVINHPQTTAVVNHPQITASHPAGPAGSPNHPQSSSNSAGEKSDELVERLKPILKKYQKK